MLREGLAHLRHQLPGLSNEDSPGTAGSLVESKNIGVGHKPFVQVLISARTEFNSYLASGKTLSLILARHLRLRNGRIDADTDFLIG